MGWVWVEDEHEPRRGLCEDYPCCGHENASCGDAPGDLAEMYLQRILMAEARGYDYFDYEEIY